MRKLGAFLCLSLMCSCASHSTAVYRPGDGICEVHHVAMVRKTIPVTFGYPYYEGPFTEAERHFPHAFEYVNGGCDPSVGPKSAAIYICPECKRVAREWALKHPKDVMAQEILEQSKT